MTVKIHKHVHSSCSCLLHSWDGDGVEYGITFHHGNAGFLSLFPAIRRHLNIRNTG
jgi:hypothetical protein